MFGGMIDGIDDEMNNGMSLRQLIPLLLPHPPSTCGRARTFPPPRALCQAMADIIQHAPAGTVLIGGGTGFVGKHLSKRLVERGYVVRHLSRSERPNSPYETFVWDVATGTIDDRAFNGVDYIINLAGAGIADKRWTTKRKQLIISSRTDSTGLIGSAIARLDLQPKHYLSASAIGYYGDRGEEVMDEESRPGTGFLSRSCVLWEDSAHEIERLGIPTFINRTGIVLHPDGGALEKMLLPLNFFTSAYFGDGQQYYSWVHLDDLVNSYVHALTNHLTGIYNGCSPNPVRNKQFAQTIGPALGKPALTVPAPEFALKVALGEMSHTVLDSCRCSAAKLEATGFRFQFPELSQALTDLLARN